MKPPGPHFPGNDGIPPSGNHRPQAYGQVNDGADNIDGGKGIRMDKPGDKNRVNDGIQPHKNHHNDRGEGKAQKGETGPVLV